MLLSLMKKIFKIESIFIYTALAIFFCTIFFKRASNNLIQKLDTEMLLLQMDPKSIVAGSDSADIFSENPVDFESIALKLRSDYQAFTYFDAPLKKELEAIIQNIQSGNRNTDAIISFQNHIHEVQTRLNLGYDSLLYSALFLIAIAAFIILEKFFKNSMQLEQLKTMQTEQSNFSRDLHDGVAQNLAALNIYLEKEDFSKSKFYAKQALNEIRYMIGSGSIEFTEDFEKIIREICTAFEVNFGIKTNLYVASQKIGALKNTQKTHLIRILQEALSNISRHSDATQVEIKIVDGIDDFRFIICDNGKGCEETEVESKKLKTAVKHYGLTNIKKRAQLIDGSADFINEGGFTIAITIKDSVH